MLVCMTEARRARYRENVVRSLAYPVGSVIQYRYGIHLVDPAVKDSLNTLEAERATVVYCYAHVDARTRTVTVVPLRFGTIKTAELVGSSVVLNVELGAFFDCSKTPSTLNEIVPQTESINWLERPELKTLAFLAKDDAIGPSAANLLDGFESAVNALVRFPRFELKQDADNPTSVFFHVIRLRTLLGQRFNRLGLPASTPTEQTSAPFSVQSGSRYEMEIYHYYPEDRGGDTKRRTIKGVCPSELIEFICDPELAVDSDYDVKKLSFDVQKASIPHASAIDISVLSADEKVGHSTISVGLEIKPNYSFLGFQLLLITLGASAPGMIGLLSSNKDYDPLVLLIMLLSGFAVALAATFGLKRGI